MTRGWKRAQRWVPRAEAISVQDALAVALRRMLPLPLDDLLAVCRAFLNPDVSGAGLGGVFPTRALPPSGSHAFDQICAELGTCSRS